MRFTFNGTIDELKDTIQNKSKEFKKDILVYHNKPDVLEIGFQRLGHSGGRFFVANITEENGKIVLTGEIKDIVPYQSKNRKNRVICDIRDWLLIYLFFEIIPLIIWLCIFQLKHIWIPIILPIPVIILCNIIATKQDKKVEHKFVEFMSTFSKLETQNEE